MVSLQILRDNYYAPSLHLLFSRPKSPRVQPFPWGPGVGALHWWIFSGMTQIGQCPSEGLALETRPRTPAELAITYLLLLCGFKKAGLKSNQWDLILLCGVFMSLIDMHHVMHIKGIQLSLKKVRLRDICPEDVGNFLFARCYSFQHQTLKRFLKADV